MRNLIKYINIIIKDTGFTGRISLRTLKGDGSDRKVFRVRWEKKSAILVYNPLGISGNPSENDSFFFIASHLKARGLPSPEIFNYQPDKGRFLMEDFGDLSLADSVLNREKSYILDVYKNLIQLLIAIQVEGAQGFREGWCYDTPVYDGTFSLKRETEYFVREFVQGFLRRTVPDRVRGELEEIAGRVDEEKIRLFLYRDFQSRNVMVREKGFGLIDFQAGRLGPPQYDLASLLIDPYVKLAPELQEEIRDYYIQLLLDKIKFNTFDLLENYRIIALQRNLQILGAFSYLSRFKGKKYFETYIPAAVANLRRWVVFSTFKPYRHFRRFLGEI